MGFFGKILAHSAGEQRSISCQSCSNTYHGNIDKRFPYAICGICIENAMKNASGQQYSELAWEAKRRENLW
jgi:hypothetical protein